MSIGIVGTPVNSNTFTSDGTVTFDMPNANNPCLFAFVTRCEETGTFDSVTFAGAPMVEIGSVTPGFMDGGSSDATNIYGFYQINPSVGSGDLHALFDTARDTHALVFALENVHQTSPISGTTDAASTTSDNADSDWAASVTSQLGNLVVFGIHSAGLAGNQIDLTGGAGQNTIIETSGSSSDFAQIGWANGAASVDLSWVTATAAAWSSKCFSVVPAVSGRSRAVHYYYDLYDPLHRILDEQGRVVPPWEVKADRWIKVAGLLLPSAKKPASFVEDPTVGYIESVTLMPDGSLDIKTSRSELTEVLLARAAGRTTL